MLMTITPRGELRCIYTEDIDLDELGPAEIRRASNVEPGTDGWMAQIVGGPLLGPFQKRSQAIQAEIAWLEENVL